MSETEQTEQAVAQADQAVAQTEPAVAQAAPGGVDLRKVVESLLFITDRPLTLAEIGKIAKEKDIQRLRAAVEEIAHELQQRGSAIQVLEIAGGYQMATRRDFAPYVRQLFKERLTMRLSVAALETLSIIAYKQPLTRAEVEEIRGVEVIAALETLLEKRLVRVVGRKETVGRPLLYGTTPDFMRQFGLRSLADLPSLESLAAAAEQQAAQAAAATAAPAQAAAPSVAQTEGPFEPRQGEAPAEAEGADADPPRGE